jgi:hypothetical protein
MKKNKFFGVIQSFSRYEFKYILSKNKADKIENEIKHFMVLDKNAIKKANNKYFVRSLYFDNPINSNFYEKVDGMQIRKKFRIRSYSNYKNSKNPIFLEMKGRRNQRTYKMRTIIKPNNINLLLDRKKFKILKKTYSNNEVINNFIYESLRKKIEPKVIVDYFRKPYVNKFGLLFRLTFDSNILASPAKNIFYNENFLNLKECMAGNTVLELKFERSIHPWFHRLIQNYNLTRLSVSKFSIGMENSGFGSETSN